MAGGGTSGEADFGYRQVAAAEKPGLVRAVFDSVAPRYDLMNDLMSLGVHRLWKAALIDRLAPRPGQVLLDVAGGTGDIALRFLERIGGRGRAILCDVNEAMLRIGRDRAVDAGRLDGVEAVCGDAERLPVASASVDAYTIAFGLRNVTDRGRALAEARRVLRPGGRFLCLEFSPTPQAWLKPLYDGYSFAVLPALGRIVAGDAEAYRYLAESVRRFPPPAELADAIAAAGLERVRIEPLSAGIAVIHAAWRL